MDLQKFCRPVPAPLTSAQVFYGPPAPFQPYPGKAKVSSEGTTMSIVLSQGWDDGLLDWVRGFEGRTWNGRKKAWCFPKTPGNMDRLDLAKRNKSVCFIP